MKKILLPLLCCLIAFYLHAQTDSVRARTKNAKFRTTVAMMDKKMIRGSLSGVNDSQATVLTYARLQGSKTFTEQNQAIAAENINSISFKRKNSVLRGALIGLGVGALTGVIIGLASGDDPVEPVPNDPLGAIVVSFSNSFAMTAGEKAVAGGIALGAGGAIAGVIIGAIAHKKFTIGGKKEKFHDLQADLMRRIVVK